MFNKIIEKIIRENIEELDRSKENRNQEQLLKEYFLNKDELYQEIESNNYLWDIPTNEQIFSHRKILGSFIVFGKKLARKLLYWYVSKPLIMQKNFNASITRTLNYFYNQFLQLVDNFNGNLGKIEEELNKLENEVLNLSNLCTRLDQENSMLQNIIKSQEQHINNLNIAVNGRFKLDEVWNINYLEFENQFRGREEDIKKKLADVYLPIVKDKVSEPIIDIGCGRGELVEILSENGYKVTGIDLNDQMVQYCLEKKLNVHYADATEYLENIEDESVGTIFTLHVLEHLSPLQIMDLLKLCYRKLKKGGLMIMETPNPECLYTLAYGFTIDLTHKRMLHPYTMQFIFDEIGFSEKRVKHLSPVEEKVILKTITENEQTIISKADISTINQNTAKINNLLFSYQDYAIIARK